jgi:hypothetical protein
MTRDYMREHPDEADAHRAEVMTAYKRRLKRFRNADRGRRAEMRRRSVPSPRTRTRSRGAGRPAASSTRSSAKSGDSPASDSDPEPAAPLVASLPGAISSFRAGNDRGLVVA